MLSKLPKLAIFGAGLILGLPLGLWIWQSLPSTGRPLVIGWAMSIAAILIVIRLLWRDDLTLTLAAARWGRPGHDQ